MPLHDWSALSGWDGVHHVWISELLLAIKPLLPPAYRVYVSTTPTFALGGPDGDRPDVGVRDWPPIGFSSPPPADLGPDPDDESVVGTLVTDSAVHVERSGRLVAAIELVSPRSKDRPSARAKYTADYAGYLRRGIQLLLVDLHRLPVGFSFPDQIAADLDWDQPAVTPPCAIGYRVGGPAPSGGKFLAVWRRPLGVGDPLPVMRLPLCGDDAVRVDLEATYRRAAEASYLG